VRLDDANGLPVINLHDQYLEKGKNFYHSHETTINNRKKYWEECYSKYKKLYF
jgi:hypothetical protein